MRNDMDRAGLKAGRILFFEGSKTLKKGIAYALLGARSPCK